MKKTIIIFVVMLAIMFLSVYNLFVTRALKNKVIVHESVLLQIVNLINNNQSNKDK